MSDPTAGHSFLLEFSQGGINKIVRALFETPDQGVPTAFRYDGDGQLGLLSSRETVSGRVTYQRYLIEGLVGYELSLYEPLVQLLGGERQQVKLSVGFDFTLFRQLVLHKTSDQLEIPPDPSSVDPNRDYLPAYQSELQPPEVPSVKGRIVIVLNLASMEFGAGNCVTIDATGSELSVVEKVDIQDVDWPLGFEDFVETVAAKSISTILKNEIRNIDVTSQFGIFNIFGLTLRSPIHLRIGGSDSQPSLAVGMHEWSLIKNGRPLEIVHESRDGDYATQIDEGFFSLLIAQMQNGEIIPRRFNLGGAADQDGPILLHNIRLSFEGSRIRIHILVTFNSFVDLFAQTFVRLTVDGAGVLKFDLEETRVHIQLQGVLGGVQRLLNTVTFYVFDSMVSKILGDLLEADVERPIGKTLDEFLAGGKLGFAFKSPIRDTNLVAALRFTEFGVEPGRALIRGDLSIEEADNVG